MENTRIYLDITDGKVGLGNTNSPKLSWFTPDSPVLQVSSSLKILPYNECKTKVSQLFDRPLMDDQFCVAATTQTGSSPIGCLEKLGAPLTQVTKYLYIIQNVMQLHGFLWHCRSMKAKNTLLVLYPGAVKKPVTFSYGPMSGNIRTLSVNKHYSNLPNVTCKPPILLRLNDGCKRRGSSLVRLSWVRWDWLLLGIQRRVREREEHIFLLRQQGLDHNGF